MNDKIKGDKDYPSFQVSIADIKERGSRGFSIFGQNVAHLSKEDFQCLVITLEITEDIKDC